MSAPRRSPGPGLSDDSGPGLFDDGGRWLWAALAVGALARLWLVFATEGTTDVAIWAGHAKGVLQHGLGPYYLSSRMVNHPPLALYTVAGLRELADAFGVPFRVVLRLPFAVLDLATAWLLSRCGETPRARRGLLAGYWLNPLAWIYSSYHGNTDSALAFFTLASLLSLRAGRAGAAGALLGLGGSLKIPALLAAPALIAGAGAGRRLRFAATAAAVVAAGFVLLAWRDPGIAAARVFGYGGMIIRTPAGEWIWGIQSFYWLLDALGSKTLSALLQAYYGVNGAVCLGAIALYAWLSRAAPGDPHTLGRNVAASYFILYGLTNYWSFQYLAWSLPFWLLVGPRFATAATAVLGGYVYGVYAHACGNPWLLGPWDFVGHPVWPLWLRGLRNAAVLFSLGSAIAFGVSAWRQRPRRTPAQTRDPSGPAADSAGPGVR